MAVKLRLTRIGKTKQPQYRIVAADSRSPRDGRFIQIVGTYNPRTEPSALKVDNAKVREQQIAKLQRQIWGPRSEHSARLIEQLALTF